MRAPMPSLIPRRAMTLMEVTIAGAFFLLIILATMKVLVHARTLRAMAEDRGVLALLAQSELDRLRRTPAELSTGESIRTDPAWQPDVSTRTVVAEGPAPGLRSLRVEARRETLQGLAIVSLETMIEVPE